MRKLLNVTRSYTIDRRYEQQFNLLEKVVIAPFHDSKYSIFGNYFLTDPPEFIFMAKWLYSTPPTFADIASTKLSARLFKEGSQSKIIVTTQSNPVIIGLCFLFILAFLTRLLLYRNSNDIKDAIVFLVYAFLVLVLDRFIKRLLLASFERDIMLIPN